MKDHRFGSNLEMYSSNRLAARGKGRVGAKNGDCHQFALHPGPRNEAPSLKRIGWLYPIFRDVYFHHGLLGEIETARAVTAVRPPKRPLAGASRFGLVAALAILLPSLAVAGKFYPDDPLLKEPPPLPVEDASFRKLNDYVDLFQNMFAKPGGRQPTEKEIRKAQQAGQQIKLIPAQSANTLGEVPDSAWFTNRIGSHPVSVEDVMRGPGNENAPALDGPWEIVAAKTEGVTPGFRIRDSKGRQYFLKFDPAAHPEMATSVDVVGSRLFYALGYNVPENYLVTFARDRLVIAKGTTFKDITGQKRPMTLRDVTISLLNVPRDNQGRLRGVASLLLPGKILGEFRYYGTRKDDPNNIIDHEHRRELRGLFVFCGWLNHSDSRAINTLDSLVEVGGVKFVRHYLIDFGSILGSASVVSNSARDGNAYLWDFKPAVAQMLTLGIYTPRWMRARYKRSRALGMLEYPSFDPERFKPNYPSPAFENRLPDDEFWAAKKVMAFTDEQIRAVVKAAQYSNPADEELLGNYLIGRRDKIGRTYFAKVLPLDRFRVTENELKFDDLEVTHGFRDSRNYSVEWSRFDHETEEHTPIPDASGFQLPKQIGDGREGSYFAALITGEEAAKTATVYLRKEASGLKVVGIECSW